MAGITIENVTKRFGTRTVLNRVSLEVEEGSFTFVLGPPGAGKTTLLRIIAGLEEPTEGRILFNGRDVSQVAPQERGVSMVFQDFALYPHLTVLENIASPLRAINLPDTEIEKEIKSVVRILNIEPLLDRRPFQLSGGERQRVAIARVLVKKPQIALFDEPLVNLDYKIREEMRAQFKAMQQELGQTIIYATPDPLDAMVMADKVALINEGIIQQYAKVDDAYNKPANVFCGVYLGFPPMNTIDGILEKKENEVFFSASSLGAIKLTNSKLSLLSERFEATIGIRPEHIYIHQEKKSNFDITLEGEVVIGEVIGSDTILHVKVGNTLLKSFVPRIERLIPGSKTFVSFNLENVYFFKKDTGERIS